MMTHLATCKMNNEEHKLTVSVKFDMTPFQWNQEVWHILNLTTAARPTAQKLYKWTSKKSTGNYFKSNRRQQAGNESGFKTLELKAM